MASTSTQMASDSSPSTPRFTYDVFLSFRGEDTRYNFTGHLYAALVQRGINTFRDDILRRGEEIEPELLKAIEESRSSIVVFSKNYAGSRWCLDELAKIMECRRKSSQIILPIFYHVDPSDVRKQTGSFGEAFTRYEENWRNKVQRWREALSEASNISGWHIKEGYESEHIKEITSTIASRISNCELLFVNDNLVGMDSHFKKISLGLSTESNDVRMIGICGIGGIGKTTIVQYVYDQISRGFECSSFLVNVREVYEDKGPLRLQNQLLNDILNGGNKEISHVHQGACMIKNSLYLRKALIVFDDVDDKEQLEFLARDRTWFGKGSRIIITTRNRHLLTTLQVDHVYEVEGLNFKEALKLFSQHAFLPNRPKEDYGNLVDRVIRYCQGLPLALKVLGSLLCGKTIDEWKSELHKLEKEPEAKIQKVLKTSFDKLDRTQKKIFLDIACFFKGEDRGFVSKILDGCDLYGERGIGVLWERCLITISQDRIYMHDLIQQMGWEIIREQHPDNPSQWSRLWNRNDIHRAFNSEKGMENVETISLDLYGSEGIWFTRKMFSQVKKVFAKMKELRLLKVNYRHDGKYKMHLPKGFEFPSNLRYLHWEGLESLPSNFHGENLVAINLKHSNIKKLLEGKKHLAKLKFIDLSYSRQLIKIPEFSRMPKLEKLNLEGCISFCKLYSSSGTFSEMKFLTKLNFSGSGIRELSSSIGSLISLERLDLSFCSKFEKFPDTIFVNMGRLTGLLLYWSGIKELPSSIVYLQSLESLSLIGCSNFEKFPEIQRNMGSLRSLCLYGTAIKELPCSIGHLTGLDDLNLKGCKNLRSLPSSICGLKWLDYLNLKGCSNLVAFPEIMEDMEHLRGLSLSGTLVTELRFEHLKGLELLKLINCENLVSLPNSIGNLTCLSSLLVRNCSKLHKLPDNLRSLQCCLKTLDLAGCNLMEGAIPSDLWCLFSLESLSVSENYIRCIPAGIIQLSKLCILSMNHCQMLEEIPELPSSIEIIKAHGCPRLGTLSTPSSPLWSSLLNLFKSRIQDFGWQTDSKDDSETRVVLPGNRGIPEWVSHKSMGHEITIELPTNWYEDNYFLGFALFSHHVPLDEDGYYHISQWSLSIFDDDQYEWVGGIEGGTCCETCSDVGLSRGCICFDNGSTSDPALCVTCFPKFPILSEHGYSRWKNFEAQFNTPTNSSFQCGTNGAFKVKSCGIHLIYAQDHHQQNQSHWSGLLRENTSFSAKRSHNDTEEDPHQKRSRHL